MKLMLQSGLALEDLPPAALAKMVSECMQRIRDHINSRAGRQRLRCDTAVPFTAHHMLMLFHDDEIIDNPDARLRIVWDFGRGVDWHIDQTEIFLYGSDQERADQQQRFDRYLKKEGPSIYEVE